MGAASGTLRRASSTRLRAEPGAGFDTMGFVEVQAPPEVIEAKSWRRRGKTQECASSQGQKPKISWGRSTFERLVAAQPEPLRSHFRIDHSLALNVLSGERDAGEHLLWLARTTTMLPRNLTRICAV